MTRRHRVVSFHANELDGGIHAREDGWFDRRAPRQKHAWSLIQAEPIPDDEPIPEMWLDEFDGNEPAYEAWVDDLDENGELSRPQIVLRTHDCDESKRGHAGNGITGQPHSYASWKVGTRARKSWARHPHRHPTIEVWEMEVTAMGTFHDGGREAIERRLTEQGVDRVKVVIVPRQRAA